METKERKFITPVSMMVKEAQLNYIVGKSQEIGVYPDYVRMGSEGICIDNRNFVPMEIENFFIDHYNPELFLALAAMSEGDQFWPGEFVAYRANKTPVEFGVIDFEQFEDHPFVDSGILHFKNWKMTANSNIFRKATKEELIVHFTKQPDFQFGKEYANHPGWDKLAEEILTEIEKPGTIGSVREMTNMQREEWLKERAEYLNKAKEQSQVNHPPHYGGADNPYEAIKVIQAWNLGFCLGNTLKYICRAEKKSDKTVEDLKKGLWYLQEEIKQLEK